MKLKSFKYLFGFLILIIFTQLKSEEKIDIWKKKSSEKKEVNIEKKEDDIEKNSQRKIVIKPTDTNDEKIQIENTLINSDEEDKIYGLYDPVCFLLHSCFPKHCNLVLISLFTCRLFFFRDALLPGLLSPWGRRHAALAVHLTCQNI